VSTDSHDLEQYTHKLTRSDEFFTNASSYFADLAYNLQTIVLEMRQRQELPALAPEVSGTLHDFISAVNPATREMGEQFNYAAEASQAIAEHLVVTGSQYEAVEQEAIEKIKTVQQRDA